MYVGSRVSDGKFIRTLKHLEVTSTQKNNATKSIQPFNFSRCLQRILGY